MSAEPMPPEGFDRRAVDALDAKPIPATTKGFGGVGPQATTPAALLAAETRLFGGTFTFPLLTLRGSAVAQNIAHMNQFCTDHHVRLAPHAKTTMAPHLFAAQLASGAWGLTVASITQAQVCRQFGVRRLLLANEVVDRAGIAWLAAEHRTHSSVDLICYVDSVEGVGLLDAGMVSAAGPAGDRRLGVLVELGFDGGRTGCRSLEVARSVVTAVHESAMLSIAGVAGYEGGLAHDRSAGSEALVRAFCRSLVGFATELTAAGGTAPAGALLVSAGGSAFPDLVAESLAEATQWATVVLRSGCYVTHDDGVYAGISPFTEASGSAYALTAALELWAPVLSRPEPGLAILGAGRRDAGFDQGFPVPLRRRDHGGALSPLIGAQVTQLNDQHAYLDLPPGTDLAVGDLVGLGVSHPCTTIDRWPYLVEIDDTDRVSGIFPTFF